MLILIAYLGFASLGLPDTLFGAAWPWLHASYSLGAMLGPLIMIDATSSGHSWRSGYFTIATILLFLSCVFAVTRSKWKRSSSISSPMYRKKILI